MPLSLVWFHSQKEFSYRGVIRTLLPWRLLRILAGLIVYTPLQLYETRGGILIEVRTRVCTTYIGKMCTSPYGRGERRVVINMKESARGPRTKNVLLFPHFWIDLHPSPYKMWKIKNQPTILFSILVKSFEMKEECQWVACVCVWAIDISWLDWV
jgi:hypothetical protein